VEGKMTGFVRFSSWPAALFTGICMAGCAPQSDFSAVSTSPVAMVCDGGKTFTVSYANGFETAVVEAQGRRLELEKVRTSLGMNPTPGLDPDPGSTGLGGETFSPGVDPGGGGPSVAAAGTTGVRYSGDDAYYLSRNRAAVLEIGDEIYSNCQVAR
jgi:hypothetical protein